MSEFLHGDRLTRDDLEHAAMFTVFKDVAGKCEVTVDRECWILSHIDLKHSDSVASKLESLGIEPYSAEVEMDDEKKLTGEDDLDAAVAYLDLGGALVKVPDTMTSKYYRFLVVDPVPKEFRGALVLCERCGKPNPSPAHRYCGAACCARAEAGEQE